MPTVDLNAILQPVVDAVRDLYFPSTVSIQTLSATQDSSGQPVDGWSDAETDVPALVEPKGVTEVGGGVIVTDYDVTILLADEHAVTESGRVVVTAGQGAGDVFDVAGVEFDPVRVTTTVRGRRVTPRATS